MTPCSLAEKFRTMSLTGLKKALFNRGTELNVRRLVRMEMVSRWAAKDPARLMALMECYEVQPYEVAVAILPKVGRALSAEPLMRMWPEALLADRTDGALVALLPVALSEDEVYAAHEAGDDSVGDAVYEKLKELVAAFERAAR